MKNKFRLTVFLLTFAILFTNVSFASQSPEYKLSALTGNTDIAGDVNNDEYVDLKDIVRLKKYMASNEVAINRDMSDVDCDGEIISNDLARIRKFLLGIGELSVDKMKVTLYNPADKSITYPVSAAALNSSSALSIRNAASGTVKKVSSIKSEVSPFNSERAYQHHPFIAYFKDKFYAIWSQGSINEDDVGQRVMISVSNDCIVWSTPNVLANPSFGDHSLTVLTADGLYSDGNVLVAYYFEFEYPEELLNSDGTHRLYDKDHSGYKYYSHRCLIKYSYDGINWIDGAENAKVNNLSPRALLSGRLLKAGGDSLAYTDDTTGLTGWKRVNMPNVDKVKKADGLNTFCETSFYQLPNGVIRAMVRTDSGYLYASESYDNAQTFSQPYKTGFVNDNSKTYFGTLPDGRSFFVGTIEGNNRCPLMLCISQDGNSFSKHYTISSASYTVKQRGEWKGGSYGYPSVMVSNENLFIIYSKGKEVIESCIIPISQLR